MLPVSSYEALIKLAIEEDLGATGDITSIATIPIHAVTDAHMAFRVDGVVCGLSVAEAVFKKLDPSLDVTLHTADGNYVSAGTVVLSIKGTARSILAGERIALNFVQRLSGIASEARKLAQLILGTRAVLSDTRKTTPGYRALEKYAVFCGGGVNHRMGLYDAVLIKDNHIVVAGGVKEALAACKGRSDKIEIEVDTLDQLQEALDAGAEYILLDNMSVPMLREAVAINKGRAVLEASGGIGPANILAVAETGVDVISVGWITHSAPALDVGIDISLIKN